VVENLINGRIPKEWQHSKVVMIPKLVKDHSKTKGWRPINLINCIGKLGEKVVADRLQESGLLHRHQFGLVKGRSATEAALRVVTRAQRCMAAEGAVGWNFWDVKGGFQNVREEDVIRELEKSEEGKKWIPWVKEFFRAREFELEWDGKVRGKGKTNIGAPQGSPLSPVIFLIWMAPIITKMEEALKNRWPTFDLELPSYVDDLHLGVSIWERIMARGIKMDEVLDEADKIVNRIAAENRLPLEDSKHERLILQKKRRRKNKDVKWVKWLGIIMDESLTFKEHWKAQIKKARAMLAQFNGLGNSQWGISASNWRQIYTGMIRAIALWGSELGWRGQRDWEKDFEQLQYQALKKCVNATHGSKIELISQIAGVESPRMALDAAQARLMGKIMRDTTALGDLMFDDGTGRNEEAGREWDDFGQEYTAGSEGFTSVLTVIQNKAGVLKEEGHEKMSYRGRVEKVEVPEVKLQAQADSKAEVWTEAINQAREYCEATGVYTDGSMNEDGMVGGG